MSSSTGCPTGCAIEDALQCEAFDTSVTCTNNMRMWYLVWESLCVIAHGVLAVMCVRQLLAFRAKRAGLTTKVRGSIMCCGFAFSGCLYSLGTALLWGLTPGGSGHTALQFVSALALAFTNIFLFALVVYVALFWYRLALLSGNDMTNLQQRVLRRKRVAGVLLSAEFVLELTYRVLDGLGSKIPAFVFLLYNLVIITYICVVCVSTLILGWKVFRRGKFGRTQRKAQQRAMGTKTQQEYTQELTIVVLVIAVSVVLATLIAIVYTAVSLLSHYQYEVHLTYIILLEALRVIAVFVELWTLRPMKIIDETRDRLSSTTNPSIARLTGGSTPKRRSTFLPMAKFSVKDALSKLSTLKDCDAPFLAQLASKTAKEVLTEGDIIVKQGTPVDALYIIESGDIALFVPPDDKAVSVLGESKPLNEKALHPSTTSADTNRISARALNDAIVHKLSREAFLGIVDATPRYHEKFEYKPGGGQGGQVASSPPDTVPLVQNTTAPVAKPDDVAVAIVDDDQSGRSETTSSVLSSSSHHQTSSDEGSGDGTSGSDSSEKPDGGRSLSARSYLDWGGRRLGYDSHSDLDSD